MDSELLKLIKNKESLVANIAFYILCSLLVVFVLSYFILAFKANIQAEEINELDNMIAEGEGQQKAFEDKVLEYRRKINDYALVIGNHKISSEVFDFIEKRTLSNVWFSTFDMSQYTNEIRLTGETENLESLSQQVQVFEKSQDYINNINVLDSQVQGPSKVRFTMALSLNPNNFTYIDLPSTSQSTP